MRGFALALVAATILAGSIACQTAKASDEAVAAGPAERSAEGPATTQNDSLLPPNYRRFIAAALLKQYLDDGDGPPEISQPVAAGIFRKTPRMMVRFRLSPEGAHGMLISFRDPPPRRYRCIDIEADRGTFSDKPYFSFKHPRTDPGDICGNGVSLEPFTELEQMAAKVRGCRSRGENQCVVADAVAKPDDKAAAPAAAKKPAKTVRARRAPKPVEANAEH